MQEATISRSREFASAAIANLDVDPELSVLLAIEAAHVTGSADRSMRPEAEDALHRAVAESRTTMTIPGIGGPVAWGANGTIATTRFRATRDRIRDADSGELLRTVDAGRRVTDLAFDAPGGMLAATTNDGGLLGWDAASGAETLFVPGIGRASGVSFDRTGQLAAAAWPKEGVVRVVDASSGRVTETIRVAKASDTSLSPDGEGIAIAAMARRTEDRSSSWT